MWRDTGAGAGAGAGVGAGAGSAAAAGAGADARSGAGAGAGEGPRRQEPRSSTLTSDLVACLSYPPRESRPRSSRPRHLEKAGLPRPPRPLPVLPPLDSRGRPREKPGAAEKREPREKPSSFLALLLCALKETVAAMWGGSCVAPMKALRMLLMASSLLALSTHTEMMSESSRTCSTAPMMLADEGPKAPPTRASSTRSQMCTAAVLGVYRIKRPPSAFLGSSHRGCTPALNRCTLVRAGSLSARTMWQ